MARAGRASSVGFVNVVLRYIGRWQHRALTSNRYVEPQWMLFGAIFLFAFPYVLKHGINVRVDFSFQNFSRKVQALIDFVGHLLSLVPYCLFAIWVIWDYALNSLFQRPPRLGHLAGVGGVGEVARTPGGCRRRRSRCCSCSGSSSCCCRRSPS